MFEFLIRWCWPICFAFASMWSLHAEPKALVPKLGSQVPAFVLESRTFSQECLTAIHHHEPCASVRIAKVRFTIAWDADTKTITYIFTDDVGLVMDSELGVGGSCRLVQQSGERWKVVRYLDWLIIPAWWDTALGLSGVAYWHALFGLEAEKAAYGTIVGFVQSRYLKGPN